MERASLHFIGCSSELESRKRKLYWAVSREWLRVLGWRDRNLLSIAWTKISSDRVANILRQVPAQQEKDQQVEDTRDWADQGVPEETTNASKKRRWRMVSWHHGGTKREPRSKTRKQASEPKHIAASQLPARPSLHRMLL